MDVDFLGYIGQLKFYLNHPQSASSQENDLLEIFEWIQSIEIFRYRTHCLLKFFLFIFT